MTLRIGTNAYRATQFNYGKIYNEEKFEVLIDIRGKPRQFAICNYKADAKVITEAMNQYVNNGGDWIP